jgi:integration host factor subunit alpha
MTKADIAEKIQERTGLTKKESTELMEAAFVIMKDIIATGETLKISGFGSFIVQKKGDRRGRNPQTGEEITIKARSVLTFKASNMLRDVINQ